MHNLVTIEQKIKEWWRRVQWRPPPPPPPSAYLTSKNPNPCSVNPSLDGLFRGSFWGGGRRVKLLVLELWKFSFIRDWPEIQKSEVPPSAFCPISGDWGKLGMPHLARMFLIKSYWILQNVTVTAFPVSKLLRGKDNKRVKLPHPTPTQIRVKPFNWLTYFAHLHQHLLMTNIFHVYPLKKIIGNEYLLKIYFSLFDL